MKDTPLRILYVVWGFPVVSQTFILNQITGLLDRGHDVEILSLTRRGRAPAHADVGRYGLIGRTRYVDAPPQPLLRRIAIGAVKLAFGLKKHPARTLGSIDFSRFGRQAANLQLLFAASGIDAPIAADVIHCHFGPVGNLAVALRELGLLRGPIVTTFHGLDVRLGDRRGPAVYATLVRGAEAVVAISPGNREKLLAFGFPPDRVLDHPVGVAFAKLPNRWDNDAVERGDAVRLLTVARLVPEKSIHVALQALRLLQSRAPARRFRYRIIGGGPLRSDLQRLSARLGLSAMVRFDDSQPQEEVLRAYATSDVFLLPSAAEVLPVALMEAQGAGLPVVATDVGDVSCVTRHGVSGYLVPPNDPEAFANAICDLLDARDDWPRLGAAGRCWVEAHYDVEILNERLCLLLQSLARRRP